MAFSCRSIDEMDRIDIAGLSTLKKWMPNCPLHKLARIEREGVASASELAMLDKKDLKELGFSMLERRIILRWCRTIPASGAFKDNTSHGTRSSRVGHKRRFSLSQHLSEEHLENATRRSEFWLKHAITTPTHSIDNPDDVREDLLERLYDINPERVEEEFEEMLSKIKEREQGNENNENTCAEELGNCLERLGIASLQTSALNEIIGEVSQERVLEYAEFSAILTRLKLAQLFAGRSRQECAALSVIDYTRFEIRSPKTHPLPLQEFFFGYRARMKNGDLPVRWIHFPCPSGFRVNPEDADDSNLQQLLAFTLKYQWHPLAVEDVIEQCSTRLDLDGPHYFAAIEELVLVDDKMKTGEEQIRVTGGHTSIFCSGPPEFDTLTTITQTDKSFSRDWPEAPDAQLEARCVWVKKLRRRLGVDSSKVDRSRLRERRAEFLMYTIIDLCSDDLVTVVHAYTARLRHLEIMFHRSGDVRASEVSRISLELNVVYRRLRSLHRVARRLKESRDMMRAGLAVYIQDVLDHLEEALEDSNLLSDKCSALLGTYERADDGTKKMNKILFMVTAATTIWLPLHFMTAVYGMNFVNLTGSPTIPELLYPYGYLIFWIGTIAYVVLICHVLRRMLDFTFRWSRTSHRLVLASGASSLEDLQP